MSVSCDGCCFASQMELWKDRTLCDLHMLYWVRIGIRVRKRQSNLQELLYFTTL